jgi:catechol 2,3-dioxygenase-like lactoylglutathione lyase family enzyme
MIKIAHICIYTTDLKKTKDFYCQGLGMKHVFDFLHKGSIHGFYLEMSPGNYIEVFKETSPQKPGYSPMNHLCLETDDIHKMSNTLKEKGIEIGPISLGADNTYQFWFKDPNGIDIEFHQYTPESCQYTGKPVEVDWL